MAISEQDKKAVDEAVASLYYVTVHEEGYKTIDPFYTDYRDTNDFLLDTAYDNRKGAAENEILNALEELIAESYSEQTWDIEEEIMRKAGFDPYDDWASEQLDYLRSEYGFEVPFDHFLEQSIQVNILLGTKDEVNMDFSSVRSQCDALRGLYSPEDTQEALNTESGLTFLVAQQGYTMDQAKKTIEDFVEFFHGDNADRSTKYDDRYAEFTKSHDPFLASLAQEVDNQTNYMSCVVILAKMNMYQYAEMLEPGKEISIPKDAYIGFFNPWIGTCNSLGIELQKDLVIPSEMIWDAQIEGAKLDYQHSVDSICGLVKSAWKEIKEIKDAAQEQTNPEKKPDLDSVIQAAQAKSQVAGDRQGIGIETQR